jgi:hypothetical protein
MRSRAELKAEREREQKFNLEGARAISKNGAQKKQRQNTRAGGEQRETTHGNKENSLLYAQTSN